MAYCLSQFEFPGSLSFTNFPGFFLASVIRTLTHLLSFFPYYLLTFSHSLVKMHFFKDKWVTGLLHCAWLTGHRAVYKDRIWPHTCKSVSFKTSDKGKKGNKSNIIHSGTLNSSDGLFSWFLWNLNLAVYLLNTAWCLDVHWGSSMTDKPNASFPVWNGNQPAYCSPFLTPASRLHEQLVAWSPGCNKQFQRRWNLTAASCNV